MARSWDAFAKQRSKYDDLHSSADFRKKQGLFEKAKSFFSGLFGR